MWEGVEHLPFRKAVLVVRIQELREKLAIDAKIFVGIAVQKGDFQEQSFVRQI